MEKKDKKMIIPELIQIGFRAESIEDVLSTLTFPLINGRFVEPEYLDAVIAREKQSPTGLPVGEMGVAIPHADPTYVNQTTTSIGVLSKPVIFGEMGSPEKHCSVNFVMLLAIKESEVVIPFIQKACLMFQDADFMERARACIEPSRLAEILNGKLPNLI